MRPVPRLRTSKVSRDGGEKWTRKNIVIDQRKLDRAKVMLNAETETAAVDAALDLVTFHGEVRAGIDRLVKAGGLRDLFAKY